jgi:hypothetical protein
VIANGLTLEEAEARLHRLKHSDETKWWYAYAHGHGCSMATGQVDLFVAIIEQASELRDFIRHEKARLAAEAGASGSA